MPDASTAAAAKQLGGLRATYRPYQPPPWSQRPASAKAGALIGRGISAALVLLIVVVLMTAAPVVGVILIVVLGAIVLLGISRRRGARATWPTSSGGRARQEKLNKTAASTCRNLRQSTSMD